VCLRRTDSRVKAAMKGSKLEGYVRRGSSWRSQPIVSVSAGTLGYDLRESLPDHSSLTRIRERYGLEAFRGFSERIVQMCFEAGLVQAESCTSTPRPP
jgi:hypothetical protein